MNDTTSITTPSDTEIRIEHTFNAPRELVWEAYTDPSLVSEWLGPREHTMSVQAMDVRPGGSYRYTARDSDGAEYVFFGEYREVVPPEILEATFNFEGMPGKTSVDRAEFVELEDGRTQLIAISTFDSKEDRDGMLQSGMEKGVVDSYDQLDELLARRQG